MSFLDQVLLLQTVGKTYIRTIVVNLCEHYGWEVKKTDIKIKNGLVSFSKRFVFEYLTVDEIKKLAAENRLHEFGVVSITADSLEKIIQTSVPIFSIEISCSPDDLITFLQSSNNKLKNKLNYTYANITEEQVDKMKEWLSEMSLASIYVMSGFEKYKPAEKLNVPISLCSKHSSIDVIKRAIETYKLVIIS